MNNHVPVYNCIFYGCKREEQEMNLPVSGNKTDTEDFVMNELNKTFKLNPGYVNVCMSLGGAQTKFNQALELLERARFVLKDSSVRQDIQKFLKDFE